MKILPFSEMKIVNEEGYPTAEFIAYMSNNLVLPIQHNLSDNGYRIPALTSVQIGGLVSAQNNFLVMGQTDDNTLKVILNGALKTIQVT